MRMGRRPSAAQSHLSPRPVPHRAGSAHGITNLVGGYGYVPGGGGGGGGAPPPTVPRYL